MAGASMNRREGQRGDDGGGGRWRDRGEGDLEDNSAILMDHSLARHSRAEYVFSRAICRMSTINISLHIYSI